MPLFTRRKEPFEKARKAEAGDPVPLSQSFEQKARVRIVYAMRDSAPSHLNSFGSWSMPPAQMVLTYVHQILLTE